MQTSIELGLSVTARARLHFCRHASSSQTAAKLDSIKRAVHLEPWNLAYHCCLIGTSLTNGSLDFANFFARDSTQAQQFYGRPLELWPASTVAEDWSRVGSVWTAVLSALRASKRDTCPPQMLDSAYKHATKLLHLTPESDTGWYLLSLLQFAKTATTSAPSQRNIASTALQTYRRLSDSLKVFLSASSF